MQTQTQATDAQQRPMAHQGDEHSMWVMNQWHTHLSFTMEGRNRDIMISLPATWIPLDLSHYAQRVQIEVCPNFRRMQARGMVKTITAEEAYAILRQNGAVEEQQRVLSGIQAVQQFSGETPAASEVDVEIASAEDIVLANLEGASEADAINKVKRLEMTGAMTPSLQRKLLTYAESRKYTKLKSILSEMVVSNTGASASA